MSAGRYVASINGIAAGKYGGSDGWMYAVAGSGSESGWRHPNEGIGTFLLEEGQDVVVYYGREETRLPDPVSIAPSRVKPGEPVTVKVTFRGMDGTTGKTGPAQPLPGVQVAAAGVSAVTDASGQAVLPGLPEGIHTVIVTGYASDQAPAVVRSYGRVTVVGDYPDQERIAGWAEDSVREARAAGVLLGVGDARDAAFEPKAAVTRAEFVSSLVRALGLAPAAGASFRDVPAEAWYAQEIEAAAQAGLVAGAAPGQFAPEAELTREQAAMLLVRALKIQTARSQPISDLAQVAAGAVSAVSAVVEQGWMTTQADGRFQPKMTMTREQAAVIAVRVLLRDGGGRLGNHPF
jgi:hypothetical protein